MAPNLKPEIKIGTPFIFCLIKITLAMMSSKRTLSSLRTKFIAHVVELNQLTFDLFRMSFNQSTLNIMAVHCQAIVSINYCKQINWRDCYFKSCSALFQFQLLLLVQHKYAWRYAGNQHERSVYVIRAKLLCQYTITYNNLTLQYVSIRYLMKNG